MKITHKKPFKIKTSAHVKHHATKLLVPHHVNEYRPHLIRLHGIVAVLVIALMAQVAYSFFTTGQATVLGDSTSISNVDLFTDTNDARNENGLPDLVMNETLNRAATLKVQDMFENDYWAHTSPSGVQPWKWFDDAGYSYSYAGENLAKNYPTAQATVDAWMSSQTHRENILKKDYVDVGFAVADGTLDGQPATLVVALYGAPSVTAAPVAAAETTFSAPAVDGEVDTPLSYLNTSVRSLSPVTVAVLGALMLVAIVGAVAHNHRNKLPEKLRKSWRAHHGMFTFFGMISLGILIILATGGGRI